MSSRLLNTNFEPNLKINKSNTIDRKKYIKIRSNNAKSKKAALFQLFKKKLNQTRLEIFRFFISKYLYNFLISIIK